MTIEKLVEATNAKHYPTMELSRTFVPSVHFNQTLVLGHSILVGPRGSGKTTILRMLSNDVLPFWEHEAADFYRSQIPFEGIYVRGDRAWGEMIQSLEKTNIELNDKNALAISAFNSNIFSATMMALERSLKHFIKGNEIPQNFKSKFATFLKEAAEVMQLSSVGLSFDSLSYALDRRILAINDICYQIAVGENAKTFFNHDEYKYLSLNLPLSLNLILDRFDKLLGRDQHKWALLLDEFEIAPIELQQQVFRYLRSSNQKYVYKVALIPCSGLLSERKRGDNQSTKNNDYNTVEMWHKSKNDIQKFCIDFIKRKYGKHPEDIFGETKFASKNHENWGDKWVKEFIELEKKDPSFSSWLREKQISVNEIEDDLKNADRLRKVAPLVAFRNALRAGNDALSQDALKRSRKSLAEFYCGWQAITAISEGNPRWLTIMMNEMMGENMDKRIPRTVQDEKIQKTSKAFMAMIKTAALNNNMGVSTKTPPIEIIQRIQLGIENKLLKEDFKEDIPLSFRVTEDISEDIMNSLRIAFNYGAIISKSDFDDIDDYNELADKEFRVSYMLAPVLRLPLKSERPVSLTRLINTINKLELKKPKTNVNPNQQGLF